MLFLRAIKRRFFENKQFNHYLLYALGETVLLVVGILIALYINNWNNEKQRHQTLQSYIKIIAQNIQDDLLVVERVRQSRAAAYESAVRVQTAISDKVSFTRKEFWDIAQALGDARALYSFTPNTSGYEALKTSGYLSNLQGSDIESVLYDYYDTVNRLVHKEANHNAYVRGLGLQIVSIWPKTLYAWELGQSSAITEARLLALQPEVASLLRDPNTREMFTSATWVFELMQDYQILKRLGKTLVNMNNKGIVYFDDASLAMLERNYVPRTGMGNPNVIIDGQISWHSYIPTSASADDIRLSAKRDVNNEYKAITEVRFDSFKNTDNSVHIAYPGGAEWAGLWFFIPADGSADFSKFDTLLLELKGDIGGETFLLNLEDINDPTDGSTTRIELQLTDQWQRYELDLADFKTADLTQLKIGIGFVFGQKAQSFSVRTVRYIDSNETAILD
jgi:hypothetical protein